MTTPPVTGPLTPYVTPAILQQAPTGISWNTIPFGTQVTAEQRTAEAYNIAQRATTMCDAYCNQILRATLDTELVSGPDYYCTYQQGTGNMRIILSRWPVTSIVSVMVSPNCFPRSWTTLTSGYWQVESPTLGVYGSSAPASSGHGSQSIIISSQAGGGWYLGRNGFVFQIQYTNGWPHCSLTSAVEAGATTVPVDDCTAWAIDDLAGYTGATGNVYDPGGQQEVIQCTAASVTAGPGNLTLASALNYNHPAGTMISTMPPTIQWAAVLFSTSIALTRGATATVVHSTSAGAAAGGMKGPETLNEEAELLLHGYRRVI